MLLAHQGGWDEMAMVLVPIAVVVVLLRIAHRRARAGTGGPTPDGGTGEHGP
jgi:hypothetical protein